LSPDEREALRDDLAQLAAALDRTQLATRRLQLRRALMDNWRPRLTEGGVSTLAALRKQVTSDPRYSLDVRLAQRELLNEGVRFEPTPSDRQAAARFEQGGE
jgi:hypothetical protein